MLKMYNKVKHIFLIVLMLIGSKSFAGNQKEYLVEMIVIEHPTTFKPSLELKRTSKIIGSWDKSVNVTPANEDKWQFAQINEKLQGYRVVHHIAWQQTLNEDVKNMPIRIQGGKLVSNDEQEPGWEVEGVVEIGVKNTPQAQIDLVFRKDNYEFPFHLKQVQSLKLGEWHYFDHPAFGVLFTVSS